MNSVTAVTDGRLAQLQAWLARLPAHHGLDPASARPASSDASFRRYFRVDARAGAPTGAPPAAASTLIVMDAPPAREDCRPFVHVAGLLARRGVNTPRILASNLEDGFLLLEDLGATTYADALRAAPQDAAALYADALGALVRLQTRSGADGAEEAPGLPAYDRDRLLTEMRLFPDWYVARHLQATLDAREQAMLEATFDRLAEAAQGQAQVLVHRDYHCRNLMRIGAAGAAAPAPRDANPGVLDFQDAVRGPITYDLVSLLRDAYVAWPEAQQIDWAARYWDLARAARLPVSERFDAFWRDLEWMGLQRSLKILGIFARLCYRDGKSRYLADLPVVLEHTQRVAERYDAFGGLARLLERLHPGTRRDGYTF